MVLTVKHKFALYKRFEQDIWGSLIVRLPRKRRRVSYSRIVRASKIVEFFFDIFKMKKKRRQRRKSRYVYRIDVVNPIPRKKYLPERFISIRLVKAYYIILDYRNFRRMARVAARQDGNYENNYCFLLECRLFPFVYRTNFLINHFYIMKFVRDSNVFINYQTANNLNTLVHVGDFVNFFKSQHRKIRFNLLKRLRFGRFLFNTPRYLYVNYKLLFCILLRKPSERDLAFPIKMNIYRATGYY